MKKSVKVFLDDEKMPIEEFSPPANFKLDTTKIPDGHHTLQFVAKSSEGVEGVKTIEFTIRNGPEIEVLGLKNKDVVNEQLDLSVNAYGAESKEKFLIAGSETPKAVPAWLWVILIFFISWAAFYLIYNWKP